MSQDKAIVLTFATGNPIYRTMAKALALSLEFHDCHAQRVLITDANDASLGDFFHQTAAPIPDYDHWFTKLCALQVTDADRVLFIDGDCLAIANVDRILEELKGVPFAVQGTWQSDHQWYGDFTSTMRRLGIERAPVFSGGFMYYERCDAAKTLFAEIMKHKANYDDLGLKRNNGWVVDEVCISIAMAQTGIGECVPDSRGYFFSPWNLVGDVQLDVLRGECSFMKVFRRNGRMEPRVVKPIIYHSAMAKWDPVYWREVKRVLEAWEDAKVEAAQAETFLARAKRRWNKQKVQWSTSRPPLKDG